MAQVTDKDVQRYMERAAEFAKTHPDYNETLADAARRRLNLSTHHTAEIVRIGDPSIPYWLAKRENEKEAREVVNVADGEYVNADRAADKIRRLHSRLVRNQTFQAIGEKRGEEREVSEYLEKRREDFRRGKRRRR